MNTDKRNKTKMNNLQKVDFDSLFSIPLDFFFIFYPCSSVGIRGSKSQAQKNRGERSIPGCGAGMEALGRGNDGATGGMSADILLAHFIAAAKVRRQSL
jgi:hypothetical protein